jgi:hypothetical protein
VVIPIQQETGLNDIQLGFVDMAMYWVLACAMPFSGLLGDRFRAGRIIAVSIILWGVLAALTGLAGGLIGFVLFRSVGMTAAQTLYAPSAYALMASEHKTTRTIAFSTHQGAMYVGDAEFRVTRRRHFECLWQLAQRLFHLRRSDRRSWRGVRAHRLGHRSRTLQANSITSVFDVVPPESRSSAVGFSTFSLISSDPSRRSSSGFSRTATAWPVSKSASLRWGRAGRCGGCHALLLSVLFEKKRVER